MTCPDPETLVAFVLGNLRGAGLSSVEEHVGVCPDCRAIVAGAARLDPPGGMSEASGHGDEAGARDLPSGGEGRSLLPSGSIVSRYVIEEALGAGSAGVVYRAYDPQLLRHVALKLLPSTAAPGDAQARWLREAQVMAQLSHPNVVAVHDVGLHEGSVFIAMALVTGRTIAQWSHEKKRSWQEILGVFIEAAHGLAAAHAAGIVHRDFKPDNVIVAEDGRICVVDFGLARPVGRDTDPPAAGAPPVEEARPGRLAMHLTSAGALVGTPAYMAPEQFIGIELDARSDQFSFCVALFFALYGSWPYGSRMTRDAVPGDLRAASEDSQVPRPLYEALRRGLTLAPEGRYANMGDLITAFRGAVADDGRPVPRRRRVYAIPAGLAIVLAAAIAWLAPSASPPAVCGDGRLDPAEECDDGNRSDTDGCLATCRWARCGDQKVRANVEECDDGNAANGDGCSARCLLCRAGSRSFVWPDNNHCYSLHPDPATWTEARQACERAGGADLTTVAGYERGAVSGSLLWDVTIPTWIGFTSRGGRLVPVSGELAYEPYSWAPREPSLRDGCVFQYPLDKREGPLDVGNATLWGVEACDRAMAYGCERVPWSIHARDNHAYRLITQPVAWPAARDRCRSMGGHLATVTTDEEHLLIATEAKVDAWIGATDLAVEGKFEWVTGEPFRYQVFAPREPDNSEASECLLIRSDDRHWYDRECDRPNAFLCEID